MKVIYILIGILTVALFFYSGSMKIGFKPFFIKFETPYMMFSILFFAMALSCYGIHVRREAFQDGFDKAIEKVMQLNNINKTV